MDNVVCLLCNGEERRLQIGSIKPDILGQLFNLVPHTIMLMDADLIVLVQNSEHSGFDGMLAHREPFTVLGSGVVPTMPVSSTPVSVGNARPPIPPPFGVVPGARTGIPPPGVRFSRRQASTRPATPEQLTKTIKVYHFEKGVRGGLKPARGMANIVVTEAECNVTDLNSKLRQKPGFEECEIADKFGIIIPNDESTRDLSFWFFNQKQAGNATRYFAVRKTAPRTGAAESSDDSIDEEVVTSAASRKRRLSERAIAKSVVKKMQRDRDQQEKATLEAVDAIRTPLRNTLRCTVCMNVSKEPCVCKSCENMIGCYACIEQWAATNNTCPLHRCDWDLALGAGFMKTRISFESVPGLYE
uniref:RING-type domain-containing protein n=1 Tax=Plectus sambesii TaxID=2011161 RepID=A0A914WYB1_9BILA